MRRHTVVLSLALTLVAFPACSDETGSPPTSVAPTDGGGNADAGDPPYPYEPSPANPAFQHAWGSSTLECSMTVSEMSKATTVVVGTSSIHVGWAQVSGNNQDPFIARVDHGAVAWCVAAEAQGPDGRAYGLAWDGGQTLYAVYTVVGGGTALDGKGGWLDSYGSAGSGGNKTVSVVARHDPSNGSLIATTFVASQLESAMKVNSLSPRAMVVLADGSVEFLGNPAFSPLNPDKTRMCAGGSEYPNGYRIRFSADLKQALCADTTACSKVTAPCK
ncbi:MAG: hypothetical protein HY898_05000 [Deltaproteobacteria bacterium]|nr:hypothetical protein [Deltaproteobacteria bacterium]